MKFKIQFFLLIAISIFLQNCGSTQSTSSQTSESNPELAADKLTVDMVSHLKLTNEQTTKVKAINLKYIKKSQDLRKQANGDRSVMQSLQKDKNAEMKSVLTDSQYRKYESMQKESKGGRGGGRGGGGGRGSNF